MYFEQDIVNSYTEGMPTIKPMNGLYGSIRESKEFNDIFNEDPYVLGTPPKDYEKFMHFRVKPKEQITKSNMGKLLLDPALKGLSKIGAAPFNISGKHVHLSEKDFNTLYGCSMPEHGRDLIQPGQYVIPMKSYCSRPNLLLPKPKGLIRGFSIIGGPRPISQAEVDLNHIVANEMHIPHRDSGDLVGAPTYTLAGPNGSIPIKVICAIDHLHLPENMYPQLNNLEKVLVTIKTTFKKYVYPNVLVRRGPIETTGLEVHVNKCKAIEQALSFSPEKPQAKIYKYHF